jgi:hypothetical protein
MSYPVKLVKLINGDSLVCQIDVTEEKEYATLIEPVKIFKWMAPNDDEDGAYENATFGPWDSFSHDQKFHVAKNKILCLTNPREDVIIYYNRIINKLRSAPYDRLDEDVQSSESERNERINQIAEALNKKLDLDDMTPEDVSEYMYNKDKIIKH